MLVFLALGDAKVLSFESGDAKVPDARYFAFWWNIGLRISTFSLLVQSNGNYNSKLGYVFDLFHRLRSGLRRNGKYDTRVAA